MYIYLILYVHILKHCNNRWYCLFVLHDIMLGERQRIFCGNNTTNRPCSELYLSDWWLDPSLIANECQCDDSLISLFNIIMSHFFSRWELQQQSRFNTEYKLQPYGFVDAAMVNHMEWLLLDGRSCIQGYIPTLSFRPNRNIFTCLWCSFFRSWVLLL